MALLAQGFDPSGYTPDYSGVNRANEQYFNAQQQGIGTLVKGVTDAQKEQKDLAQKDKELSARIKGSISLLDNAKALYPEFAAQIDSTKLQLSDPNLSIMDKAGIASQVENAINLISVKGTEGTKTALALAEMQQKERLAGIKPPKEPKYELKELTDPNGVTGLHRVNIDTGVATPVIPSSDTTGLGNPPIQLPTVEGPAIDPNKVKPLGYDSVGRQRVLSDGNIYHLNLDTGTLPDTRPLDQLSESAKNALIKRSESTPLGLGGSTQPNAVAIQQPAIPTNTNTNVQAQVPTTQVNTRAITSAANLQQPASPLATSYNNIQRTSNFFTAPRDLNKEASLAQSIASTNLSNAQLAEMHRKTETAQTREEQSQKALLANAQNAQDQFDKSINRVMPIINRIGSGPLSDVYRHATSWAGSSDQFKLENALKPIEANAMWEQMKAMRALSATGSTGLGAMSDREGDSLKSTIASINAYQSPEDLRLSLRLLQDHMNNAKYGNREERKTLVDKGEMTPFAYNEIEKKYLYPAPIPTDGLPVFKKGDEELLRMFKK